MIEIIRNVIVFIVFLATLVIVHEAGHWLACDRLGIAVKEIGLGLPPRARKLGEWRGATVSLNWVLLGGFVRPAGEMDAAVPGGLAASPAWKRLIVFVAGPLANFALAYLVFTAGFMAGWPERLLVDDVLPGSPAEAAGLQPGDLVLSAAGQTLHSQAILSVVAADHLHQPIVLVVQRGGQTLSVSLTPDDGWSHGGALIGIASQRSLVSYPLPQAMRRAGEEMVNQFTVTAATLVKLARQGEQNNGQARLVGIVGLKQISDQAVDNAVAWSQWFPVLNLIAFVSTALGIANLLPFPALDGGRIVFVLAELASRRRIHPAVERWANIAGMVVLLGLMVALIAHDIANPLFSH